MLKFVSFDFFWWDCLYFRCFKIIKDFKLNNRWIINWEVGVKCLNLLVVFFVKVDINIMIMYLMLIEKKYLILW